MYLLWFHKTLTFVQNCDNAYGSVDFRTTGTGSQTYLMLARFGIEVSVLNTKVNTIPFELTLRGAESVLL